MIAGVSNQDLGDIRDSVSSDLRCFKDPPTSYTLLDRRPWVEEVHSDGVTFDSPVWTLENQHSHSSFQNPSLTSSKGFASSDQATSKVSITADFGKSVLIDGILLAKKGDEDSSYTITKIKVEYLSEDNLLEYGILDTNQLTLDDKNLIRKIPIENPFTTS